MFAPAYMGRKRNFSNAFTLCATILALGRSLFTRVAEALEGAAPRLFRPMYAEANMGHTSRGERFVLCSNFAPVTDCTWRFHSLVAVPL
jgi:hypothetical protein